MLSNLSYSHLWLALGGIGFYLLLRSIYRLYFHPLSKIPGPKLTAITHGYEFYYDVICGGRFLFQIEKMHQQYGPIVRINPREVHVSDPAFYDEIYSSSTRVRDKDPFFVPTFALPLCLAATVSHKTHRFRRSLLNNFFSKRSVMELSPACEEIVQKLMRRLEESYQEKAVIQLSDAFSALSSDIITHYCFGKSWDFLDDRTFCSDIRMAVTEATAHVHLNRFLPWLVQLQYLVPLQVMFWLQPGTAALFRVAKGIYDQSTEAMQRSGSHDFKASTETPETASKTGRTIFDRLTDPSLPPYERTLQHLQDEASELLTAGTEATGDALARAAYYLAKDKVILDKLRAELKQVMPTPTSTATWRELEQLPYLTGVINEALRLSYGLLGRLPRVAPTEALEYSGYIIPPGSPVSSATYFIHRDPTLFPEPEKFDPTRWTTASEKHDNLRRYLVPFTRGTRACLGMNLVYMKLYMTIACFVRRFDIELQDTLPEDIPVTRALMTAGTRRGRLQVYARVTGMVED
ncbi:cytochrome P450 [Aspergillus egyptiacus]|nr:cytochrome P450 [Aspergillus egyptiacus]